MRFEERLNARINAAIEKSPTGKITEDEYDRIAKRLMEEVLPEEDEEVIKASTVYKLWTVWFWLTIASLVVGVILRTFEAAIFASVCFVSLFGYRYYLRWSGKRIHDAMEQASKRADKADETRELSEMAEEAEAMLAVLHDGMVSAFAKDYATYEEADAFFVKELHGYEDTDLRERLKAHYAEEKSCS